MSQQPYEVIQGKKSYHSNLEFARSREVKSNKKGKETFLSELLKSPHCPDPGLDHGFFRAVRAFRERRLIKASNGMSITLNCMDNAVLCEECGTMDKIMGFYQTRDTGPVL